MDTAEYLEKMRTIAYLAGCVLRGVKPDTARLGELDIDELLNLAKGHTLAAVTATGLESAGIVSARTQEEVGRGIWKAAQLETDWQLVRAGLEEAGIWYCPLKGAVLKDLYPAYGLRQMADYDVLFDATRADDLRGIMEAAGFTTEHFDMSTHDVYYKLPVSNFEMHRALFGSAHDPRFVEAFADIKDRLVKDEGNAFGWHMTPEDCYLHVVAHEHKHYAGGGTGLRSSLDLYVYLRRFESEMDWAYIGERLEALGLAEFEKTQRAFAKHLLDDEPLSAEEEDLFAYMATSMTYGTCEHRVANKLEAKGGGVGAKLGYLKERLFPPLDDAYAAAYPFFGERRYLLPAFYVYRLGHGLASRGKIIWREFRQVLAHSDNTDAAV